MFQVQRQNSLRRSPYCTPSPSLLVDWILNRYCTVLQQHSSSAAQYPVLSALLPRAIRQLIDFTVLNGQRSHHDSQSETSYFNDSRAMKRHHGEVSEKEHNQTITSAPSRLHAPGAVRHAEKRRTGTCSFADRIATVSLDCFRQHIPESFLEAQKQTCVSTILAHFSSDGHLRVQGLGVGTKFLPERVLEEQDVGEDEPAEYLEGLDGHSYRRGYGVLVRDCHAEVLARRAFRRQLYVDMQTRPDRSILEKTDGGLFRLKSEVTLHMYSSSAPCGNSTIKKFATMQKEVFDSSLGPNEWPLRQHEIIPPHSLKLGQFALLLKKDRTVTDVVKREPFEGGKSWPANKSDDWCPPGTTIVWSNQGSMHTCSDKICRWNYLGLQGSLLSSLIEGPLYMESLTVGRKFSSCICQRAICCRAVVKGQAASSRYSLHHPAIMGTGILMDVTGILNMHDESEFGQDVRFNSSLCYAWWPGLNGDLEVIDGSNGLACRDRSANLISRLSTASLIQLHFAMTDHVDTVRLLTLKSVHSLKKLLSPCYECAKESLLTNHRFFRGWKRRVSTLA